MTDATVELSIRDATVNDLDAVVELDGLATRLAKPDYWNDIFDRYIVNPRGNRFFLVAETVDSTVGFIVGETRMWEFGSPSCGWVFAVNVAESVREHGVGTQLMNAICERFRETGVDTVRTMISRNDPLNLSFFRGQGMTAGPYIELEKNLD